MGGTGLNWPGPIQKNVYTKLVLKSYYNLYNFIAANFWNNFVFPPQKMSSVKKKKNAEVPPERSIPVRISKKMYHLTEFNDTSLNQVFCAFFLLMFSRDVCVRIAAVLSTLQK
jgi:hypothetical protein